MAHPFVRVPFYRPHRNQCNSSVCTYQVPIQSYISLIVIDFHVHNDFKIW